jgi:hypothetical protein
MAALAGLPVCIAAILLGGTWVYARFLLFALPGSLLLIAGGIERLWSWRRAAGLAAAAVMLLAAAGDLVTLPPKQPLRDAVQLVASEAEAGDPVLAVGLAHRVLDIYAGDLVLTYSLRHGEDLRRQLNVQPGWIILYYPNSVAPETYALIERTGFVPAARFEGWVDWDNGDVLVFRRQGRVMPTDGKTPPS